MELVHKVRTEDQKTVNSAKYSTSTNGEFGSIHRRPAGHRNF
jgi:hypothetical protein